MKKCLVGLWGVVAMMPMTGWAEVYCRMPNGTIIHQKLAVTCPAGADLVDANGLLLAPAARTAKTEPRQPGNPIKTTPGAAEISSADLGKDWPLTVPKGTLACRPSPANPKLQIVTFSEGGQTYTLNGTARAQAAANGWRDIRWVWKPNDQIPGTNMPISPLLERGLALCR